MRGVEQFPKDKRPAFEVVEDTEKSPEIEPGGIVEVNEPLERLAATGGSTIFVLPNGHQPRRRPRFEIDRVKVSR